ncbi:putative uncharacterized protein [Waddlia chondrophila 2032/99]|uniref:Uncharacterized protein n=2 Tax=Waddlia chondrophila TaxID=71667 RepID=D6YV58_WADCW|nr:hypothetical protein [Waddlia chondrophila]ADI38019.1 conserved hypothetical protein [Waddlia chondrophila WSU 86-1044]CCB91081.1 putative uncharacterized protein [Waddlia chondrophila 2032/99]
MRFIFNFIFFGLLFFIIYKFLPETFETLVGWVDKLYDVLRDAVVWVFEKVQSVASNSGNAA